MRQMHKYAQFERYAKLNWEPVQTLKRRSDVLEFRCQFRGDSEGLWRPGRIPLFAPPPHANIIHQNLQIHLNYSQNMAI